MTDGTAYPDPPPQLVAAAQRDYHDADRQLTALIAGARAARRQHHSEFGLFMHVYATIRPADPSIATALAAVAVIRLLDAPPPRHGRRCRDR